MIGPVRPFLTRPVSARRYRAFDLLLPTTKSSRSTNTLVGCIGFSTENTPARMPFALVPNHRAMGWFRNFVSMKAGMTCNAKNHALAQFLLTTNFTPRPHFVVHFLLLVHMMDIQLLRRSALRAQPMRPDPVGPALLHPCLLIGSLFVFVFIGHYTPLYISGGPGGIETPSSRVERSLRYVCGRAEGLRECRTTALPGSRLLLGATCQTVGCSSRIAPAVRVTSTSHVRRSLSRLSLERRNGHLREGDDICIGICLLKVVLNR